MTKFKKVFGILALIITLLQVLLPLANKVKAAEIGDIDYLEREEKGFYTIQSWTGSQWMYVTYSITHYTDKDGTTRVAYCIDPDLKGVGWIEGEFSGYDVKIKELLSDPKLWRVYTSGYPYKSAQEIGVETNQDAYLATKMAGYAILRGYNVDDIRRLYRAGEDSIEGQNLLETKRRGQKVIDAICNLVNIGYNGTATPQYNNLIQVEKVGELTKDSNNSEYYYQEFKVSSTVNCKDYTITGISGVPEGSIVTDKNGNGKQTFSGNETFKIMIRADSITENIGGKIEISGTCENYPIYYGECKIGSYQNYILCCDSYSKDIKSTANFEINAFKSRLEIQKVDKDTKQSIEGVEFSVKYEDGTDIGTFKTNSEGKITINNLRQGNIVVTETKANDNYILDDKINTVSLGFDEQKTVILENEHKKGSIKIYKVDKDNDRVVLGNVEFDLYSEELDKIVGTFTTDVNGEIQIDNLRTGNYQLIEKSTGKWYNLADNKDVEVKWGTTEKVTIQNELKKGQIKIIKVDADNKEVKIAGVKFEVLDEKGNVLETLVTNERGEATTSKYAIRDYSKLTIREAETLENYVLNDKPQTVTLEENQIKTITFTNELKKGQIKVIKVDQDDNEIKLKDVEFNVIDEDGNIVDKLVTDENGEAVSKKLRIDKKYTVQETETLENYVLTEKAQTVTLKQDQITNLTFENKKRKGQIKVIKTDGETEYKLEGVTFVVEDESGNIVDRIVTDENGEATSKRLAIDEEYTVYEESTKKGYILSSEKQIVELAEDEITTLEFCNYKEKGSIKIIKKTSDGNNIAGIEFKITGTSFTGEEVECIYTTDENGKIFIDEVFTGEYTIEELKGEVNSNYIIPEKQTIIVENNETVELTFFNKLIETPKTGDERKVKYTIVFAVLSFIGLGIIALLGLRKKDDK